MLPIGVYMDAADVGLGVILTEKQENKDHVNACAYRAPYDAEENQCYQNRVFGSLVGHSALLALPHQAGS